MLVTLPRRNKMFRRRWGLESGGKNINRFTSTLRIQDGALTGLFLYFTFNDKIHWRSNLVTSKTPTFIRFPEEHFNILIFFFYLEKWIPPVNLWFKAFIWSRSLFFLGFIHSLIHQRMATESLWQHQSKSDFFTEMSHSPDWLNPVYCEITSWLK